MKFMIFVILLLNTQLILSQSLLSRTYLDGTSEFGRVIVKNSEDNFIIMSKEVTGGLVYARIRKLSATGVELFSFRLESDLSIHSYPEDLIISSNGDVICLYVAEQPINTPGNDLLKIKKLNNSGEIIDEFVEIIKPSTTSADILKMRLQETSDGDLVVLTPALDMFPNEDSGHLHVRKLNEDLEIIDNVSLGISSGKTRCFLAVEDNSLLLGYPTVPGTVIKKINMDDLSTTWEIATNFDTPLSEIVYQPVELGDGYGFVSYAGNSIDSLEGIRYFKLNLDGELMHQTVYNNEYKVVPSSWAQTKLSLMLPVSIPSAG